MAGDDAELVKAGVQGIAEGATKSIHDLILALFGPAAEEAGQMLREEVRVYRKARRERFLARTQSVIQKSEIDPKPVPLKLLVPIIDNASIEDDDDLQDIWANLLANAADPRERNKVRPSFPAILKELTAQDVKFLNALFETALESGKGNHYTLLADQVRIDPTNLVRIYRVAGLAPALQTSAEWMKMTTEAERMASREMELSMNTFERQGIITKVYENAVKGGNSGILALGMAYSFTSLGSCFVAACRTPKKLHDAASSK